MLKIKPSDRVLEIGSGNRPRKRSNILCDKFIAENTERSGGDDIVIDERPFVVADGLTLPFRDKTFDYVITSHILEHVDDPHRFVSELARVGKAGYIETPSELGEKIFGWPFHKWIVRCEGDTIVMRPRISDSFFDDYFHRMYAHDLNFAEFVDSHFEDFYVQYEWEGMVKIRVEHDAKTGIHFNKNMRPVNTKSPSNSRGLALFKPLSSLVLKTLRNFRKFE